MEDICVNFLNLLQFFRFLKGRCYGNQLILGDFCRCQNWRLRSLRLYYRLADACINSATNCSTSCKTMVKIGSVIFELKWGRKWKLCCDSAEIGRFSFIWHTGILKRIGISQFWFQQVNWQSFLYISWKFGEIRISQPRVLGKKNVRSESIIVTILSSPIFVMGLLGTQVISK